MSGHLELRTESSGPRHYLDGKPVHADYGLELLLAPVIWVLGRYEWSFCREAPPLLYLQLGGRADYNARPSLELRLPKEAFLRWPA